MADDRILIGFQMSSVSKETIELLLEDAQDPSLYEEVAKTNVNRPEILALLLENPDTPDEVLHFVSGILRVPAKKKTEIVRARKTSEERSESMLQKVQKLSVAERIHLALKGGKEVRTILLRDPNKEVSLTVLENPKITETEVELVARSRSISDEALRKITKKREWMKNYSITLALVTNPKTPPGIAIPLVSDLKTRDLSLLEKNKNVTEGIRATAKKLLRARRPH
ncbi:MAG: hypothetical protein AB1552_05645 [Nitrospirota bacterium]